MRLDVKMKKWMMIDFSTSERATPDAGRLVARTAGRFDGSLEMRRSDFDQ
jgi:hypothetical protein